MRALPSLRQLRYLLAIAEHRHFGRAANDCCVTQSTLSAGIRELESTLGAELVERTQRRVALTPAGESVALQAREVLAAAEQLADAAAAGGAPLTGLLRLGVIPTIAPYLLPPVLPEVRVRFPRLRLYLREERTAALLGRVEAGRLDGALIALPFETGKLVVEPVQRDRLYVACPAAHPFASGPALTAANLAGQPMLLLEDGHCLREHALTACRLAPGRANEDLQGTSLATLVQMVASGLGLTFLPEMAIEVESRREPSVAVVPIDEDQAFREVAMVWRPGAPRGRDLRLLVQLLARRPAAVLNDKAAVTASGVD
jgi:LysR family hydrogen peroxide-inducible transcriptional activator